MSVDPGGMVAPQPHPTTWQVNILPGPDGQNWLQVIIAHFAGATVVYLDPVTAQQLGGNIRKAGKQAATGLIVPSSGLVAPNGQAIPSRALPDDDDEQETDDAIDEIEGQMRIDDEA